MAFDKYQKEKIIELIKKIEKRIGLNRWDINYYFSRCFFVSPYRTYMYISNNIKPTSRGERLQTDNGVYEYLENIGIVGDRKDIGNYILSLLHEFGHIHQITSVGGNIDENIYLLNMINDTSKALLRDLQSKKLNADDRYRYGYVELYANQFAYKWFPIIWEEFTYDILDILGM